MLLKVVAGADEAEVRRRAAEQMAWENEDGDVDAYVADAAGDRSRGDAREIVEQLAAYAAAGVQRVLPPATRATDLEAVELIGREVVPAAAEL